MENIENRCGNGVYWSYDQAAACMTIFGNGKMNNYGDISELPWKPHINEIRKIVIEEGVASVGDWAFSSCEELTEIHLSGTVATLGVQCFSFCTSLASVVIPEGVRVIGSKAFRLCTALAEVHLPSTLTNIDMRAFGRDAALTVVYYGGTRLQWEQVRISMSASDNQYLVQADIRFLGTSIDAASIYKDVRRTDWFAAPVQYLTERGYLGATGARTEEMVFGPWLPAVEEFALHILYTRGGSPGTYGSAREWAEDNGLADRNPSGTEEGLTLTELAVILYRAARNNGAEAFISGGPSEAMPRNPAGAGRLTQEEGEALGWCQARGFLDGLPGGSKNQALTRAEAASVMAAYLKSSASVANRYQEIVNEMRAALKQGGNGKLYIAAPNLTTPGITAKSGDCTLILFPDGRTMMIDAGYTDCSGHVISLLEDLELTQLDDIVLSHAHDDHCGGLMAVAQYIYAQGGHIGRYRSSCVCGGAEPLFLSYIQERGASVFTGVKAGDRWEIGGVSIDIYNPEAAMRPEGTGEVEAVNNSSILMKFTYGASAYLTGGDIYQNREEQLVSVYGNALKADVLKANHHGTHTSNCERWLTAVSPSVMFAPADDTGDTSLVSRAARLGIAYYSVGADGLVMIRMDGSRKYKVVSQYDSPLRQAYRGDIGKRKNAQDWEERDEL